LKGGKDQASRDASFLERGVKKGSSMGTLEDVCPGLCLGDWEKGFQRGGGGVGRDKAQFETNNGTDFFSWCGRGE